MWIQSRLLVRIHYSRCQQRVAPNVHLKRSLQFVIRNAGKNSLNNPYLVCRQANLSVLLLRASPSRSNQKEELVIRLAMVEVDAEVDAAKLLSQLCQTPPSRLLNDGSGHDTHTLNGCTNHAGITSRSSWRSRAASSFLKFRAANIRLRFWNRQWHWCSFCYHCFGQALRCGQFLFDTVYCCGPR